MNNASLPETTTPQKRCLIEDLVYFLVYGQRGLLQYFYLSNQNQEYNETLAQLTAKNQYFTNRIKKLHPNTVDLDFLDEQVRKKLGLIDKNEIVIILDQ